MAHSERPVGEEGERNDELEGRDELKLEILQLRVKELTSSNDSGIGHPKLQPEPCGLSGEILL
jgi:hypothetical protein